MSVDWFYLSTGFFGGHKTVGPVSEVDLLKKIESGKINPETMLSSTSKTHGHWMKMKDIRAAKKVWDKSHPSSGAA